jgi:hypothetical protein
MPLGGPHIPVPMSTHPGENRFTARIWLQVTPDGLLEPVPVRRRKATKHYISLVLEFPTYEEEQDAKAMCSGHTPHGHFIFDSRRHEEWRLARCLVEWNLDTLFPNRVHPVERVGTSCTTKTVDQWKRLPPLVRKAISATIDAALGGI